MFNICNCRIYQEIMARLLQCHLPVKALSFQSGWNWPILPIHLIIFMITGNKKMSDSIRTGMLKVDTLNFCPWLEVGNTLGFVLAGRKPFFLIWVFHTFFSLQYNLYGYLCICGSSKLHFFCIIFLWIFVS